MTATRILVVGGVVDIAYAFVLGLFLSQARMKEPVAPRHLLTTHLAAIMQGTLLLATTIALAHARLPNGAEVAAAALLVAGSVLFLAGTTVNWIQRVGDHFAERSLGWRLLGISAPLNLAGIAIVLAGVVRAL